MLMVVSRFTGGVPIVVCDVLANFFNRRIEGGEPFVDPGWEKVLNDLKSMWSRHNPTRNTRINYLQEGNYVVGRNETIASIGPKEELGLVCSVCIRARRYYVKVIHV